MNTDYSNSFSKYFTGDSISNLTKTDFKDDFLEKTKKSQFDHLLDNMMDKLEGKTITHH